jgi:hypothetical protein
METLTPLPPAIESPAVKSVVVIRTPEAPAESLAGLNRIRTASQITTVIIFVLAMSVPLYGYAFRNPAPLDDNRKPTRFPDLAFKKYVIQDFPKWFEYHYNDHLGYRDVWLKWHRVVIHKAFAESSSPKAWAGQHGWLFLNVDDPDATNPAKPSVQARIEKWADVLADRHFYLKQRGIQYVVVLAPEKSAVYPEFLPLRRQRTPPPEPTAKLATALTERGVPCVNLFPALLQAKSEIEQPLYFQSDSHWNPDGARVGYRAMAPVLKQVLPDLQFQPDSEFEIGDDHSGGGDLWRFIGSPTDFPGEYSRRFEPKNRPKSEVVPEFTNRLEPADNQGHIPVRSYLSPQAQGPNVLLLRDSFATGMLPFMTADFRRVTAVPTHRFPLVALEAEQPKLVIQQMVARFIYSEAAGNPPEVAGARVRE